MKYRKRPVVIEALQWTGMNLNEMRDFAGAAQIGIMTINTPITIQSLEGWVKCGVGDWVIRGIKGEFYSCRDDIFKETYDGIERDGEGDSGSIETHGEQFDIACRSRSENSEG
jgi:hypothetical protein